MSFEDALNYRYGAPQYGCCSFHAASQSLINAHTTEANGLPNFITYNNKDADLTTTMVDPQSDHTVGIDGYPSNYNVKQYTSIGWTQDYARTALQ